MNAAGVKICEALKLDPALVQQLRITVLTDSTHVHVYLVCDAESPTGRELADSIRGYKLVEEE